MDARGDRQAENESLFRDVNERIEVLVEETFDRTDGVEAFEFVCECQDANCTERLALTVTEYEAIRADGRQFLVAPSQEHVDLTIERIVDMSTRYWVVEKIDEPGERAEQTDPRA
jgi:hypothetical protein